jgi:hypothetical protein
MKVKVTQTFRDKDNYNLVYKVGEEREFGKSRAQHLISMGLVEPISIAQEPSEELFPTDGKRKRGRKSSK